MKHLVAFKPNQLQRYVCETLEEYLPRIKLAQRQFPSQEPIYENFKLQLINQLTLIDSVMGDY